jgi:hypothetical protein
MLYKVPCVPSLYAQSALGNGVGEGWQHASELAIYQLHIEATAHTAIDADRLYNRVYWSSHNAYAS